MAADHESLGNYWGRHHLADQSCILKKKQVFSTYGHSQLKTGHPVRSAIHKQLNGRLVLRWVTTSCCCMFCFASLLSSLFVAGRVLRRTHGSSFLRLARRRTPGRSYVLSGETPQCALASFSHNSHDLLCIHFICDTLSGVPALVILKYNRLEPFNALHVFGMSAAPCFAKFSCLHHNEVACLHD